jgi:hypothetical protein
MARNPTFSSVDRDHHHRAWLDHHEHRRPVDGAAGLTDSTDLVWTAKASELDRGTPPGIEPIGWQIGSRRFRCVERGLDRETRGIGESGDVYDRGRDGLVSVTV